MNVSQILERLFLGSAPEDGTGLQALLSMGVKAIIDCRSEASDLPLIKQNGLLTRFDFCSDGVPDWTPNAALGNQPLPLSFFKVGLRFWQVEEGNKLYVHCSMGANRSVTLVYFFLRTMGLFSDDARQLLNERRVLTDWWDIFDQTWRRDAESALIQLIGYGERS